MKHENGTYTLLSTPCRKETKKNLFNSQSEIHTKIISHFSLNREEFTIVT